jgi:hypothetical protein
MRFVLACGLVASVAHADGVALDVGVGQTVERDVGIAMGLRCDDLSIARVSLRERAVDSNLFVVTGVAPGTTLCRVGLATDRPTYLFEIRVVARRAT